MPRRAYALLAMTKWVVVIASRREPAKQSYINVVIAMALARSNLTLAPLVIASEAKQSYIDVMRLPRGLRPLAMTK